MKVFGIAGVGLVLLGLVGCDKRTASSPEVEKPSVVAPLVKVPEAPPIVPEPRVVVVPVVPDDSKAEAKIRAIIPDKEALSKKLWDAAMTAGAHSHVGTMFNELDVNEHSCFILGNLLGRKSHVEKLEVSYETDVSKINEENAHDYQVMTVSLNNFVGAAKYLLGLSKDERILQWNLDCVGQMGISNDAYIEQLGKSTFYAIKNDGRVLQVLGDIEQGYADKIIAAINANPSVKTVALGSGGGYVYEAMKAGNFIRSKGLETVLWNGCYSACPLVFMGGVRRENWSPYPVLGFHQVYSEKGIAAPKDDQVYKDIYQYLVSKDIDPKYVIFKMWSAPPTDMALVEGGDEEPCNANVFTWVQRGCTSPGWTPRPSS